MGSFSFFAVYVVDALSRLPNDVVKMDLGIMSLHQLTRLHAASFEDNRNWFEQYPSYQYERGDLESVSLKFHIFSQLDLFSKHLFSCFCGASCSFQLVNVVRTCVNQFERQNNDETCRIINLCSSYTFIQSTRTRHQLFFRPTNICEILSKLSTCVFEDLQNSDAKEFREGRLGIGWDWRILEREVLWVVSGLDVFGAAESMEFLVRIRGCTWLPWAAFSRSPSGPGWHRLKMLECIWLSLSHRPVDPLKTNMETKTKSTGNTSVVHKPCSGLEWFLPAWSESGEPSATNAWWTMVERIRIMWRPECLYVVWVNLQLFTESHKVMMFPKHVPMCSFNSATAWTIGFYKPLYSHP